ncbi:hypothetical protein DL764_002991 [Monosporascus ibericus]|uniref:NACHT-NTPase and P-loop NTPases N-terminal domain-containing protein n=1 Tax=Monosporascus ibericus TaxID=155417 RepID=A0A4V1XBM2_9PEZI|nr:hypothetical protein DL764_002991 [Monosporascus ibericus]
MSGVETLGILAAASQIVAYTLEVVRAIQELRQHIKQLPAQIKCFTGQLDTLTNAVLDIQRDQHLQTGAVKTLLARIIEKVEDINDLLKQSSSKLRLRPIKKVVHIIAIKKLEKLINEKFLELEADKSNLILIITGSCKRTLTEMSAEFKNITPTDDSGYSSSVSSDDLPSSSSRQGLSIGGRTVTTRPPQSPHTKATVTLRQAQTITMAEMESNVYDGNQTIGTSNFIGVTSSGGNERLARFKNNYAKGIGNLIGSHPNDGEAIRAFATVATHPESYYKPGLMDCGPQESRKATPMDNSSDPAA